MTKSRSYCKFPIRTRFGTEAEFHQKRLFFDGPKNRPRRGPAESKLVVIIKNYPRTLNPEGFREKLKREANSSHYKTQLAKPERKTTLYYR